MPEGRGMRQELERLRNLEDKAQSMARFGSERREGDLISVWDR